MKACARFEKWLWQAHRDSAQVSVRLPLITKCFLRIPPKISKRKKEELVGQNNIVDMRARGLTNGNVDQADTRESTLELLVPCQLALFYPHTYTHIRDKDKDKDKDK